MSDTNNTNTSDIDAYKQHLRAETIKMVRMMFGEQTLNDMLRKGAIDSMMNEGLPEMLMADGIIVNASDLKMPSNPSVDTVTQSKVNKSSVKKTTTTSVDRTTRVDSDKVSK